MEFPTQEKPVIVAIKGLPYTWTDYIADKISEWAKSPWLSLDYMLEEEVYKEGGYNADRRPQTKEEDEGLRRLAFSRLCTVSNFYLRKFRHMKFKCVIIESTLSSTKDLDQLVELSIKDRDPRKVVIIEVRFRHKLRWMKTVEKTWWDKDRWYRPGSWVEVEEAIREYDSKAWEDHYHLMSSRHTNIKRLVLDPVRDIRGYELVASKTTHNSKKSNEKKKAHRWSPFGKAIEYLLEDELAPSSVEYRKWRKEHVEGIFNDSAGDCIFKEYTTTLVEAEEGLSRECKACEQPLLTGEGAYQLCVSCNLTLHKSCAMFPQPKGFYHDISFFHQTFHKVLEQKPEIRLHECKSSSCSEFSYKCGECIFKTHLKWRIMPTIIDSPHIHPHPLSLQFLLDEEDVYTCELCSFGGVNCGYYCVICNSYYHVRCAHSPARLEHEHGGHLHPMNLIFPSTSEGPIAFCGDDYLDPDDSWCVFCSLDLDSQAGYYVCQIGPDYSAHVYCISPSWEGIEFID